MAKSNCGWECVSKVQGAAQDLHPQAHRVWHFSDTSRQHQLASFKSLVPLFNSEGSGSPCCFQNFFPCCILMLNIPLAGVPVPSVRFQQRPGSVTQGSICQNLLCSTIRDISRFETVYALYVNKYWIFQNKKWKIKWFGSFHWAEVCGRRLFIPLGMRKHFVLICFRLLNKNDRTTSVSLSLKNSPWEIRIIYGST